MNEAADHRGWARFGDGYTPVMPDMHQPTSPDDDGVEEADVTNGEPDATKPATGDAQAKENQDNDPPA